MKLKRILSSFLAVVMAFGVVSLATVDENGNIFGNTLTAEAATEKTATKMPDNAITFSSTYSDELEIIPAASKNGMYYYNNKVIYFYSVANNTFRKIYDYNDKGRNKDTVICVYADAEKGKFYIVWLDSSNRNKNTIILMNLMLSLKSLFQPRIYHRLSEATTFHIRNLLVLTVKTDITLPCMTAIRISILSI